VDIYGRAPGYLDPMGCERIGHGGASAIERANTLASFDAACAIGVDMIEFDVRAWRGELVLAHTVWHARLGANLRLRQALEHLATARFADIGLHLDVKHTGCEEPILAELRRARLLDRTLLCSQVPGVLDRFRAIEPAAQVGISVGGRVARFSCRWGDWRAAVLRGLATRRWDALMAQHKLVDASLIEAVSGCGARLYAWTVNERGMIDSLRGLGVHGITTADPRLFA
jgi:glycerophosphoryl diester phosphodiesterase